jgi:hypothetical protein
MPEARLDLKHLGILMRSHAKYAVRGGSGISFLLIVVVVGLTVAGFLVDPLDGFRKTMERESGGTVPRDKFIQKAIEDFSPIIGWWIDAKPVDEDSEDHVPGMPFQLGKQPPEVEYLVKERPALLSLMFLILLALEPFMMAFGGFNQLSGDIANRGLRYLLLRTSRLNVVLARLVGTFLFSALTSLFTVGVIIGFLAVRYDLYPIGDLVTWGLYGWGALNLFSLPYLALCTWISTAVASPFAALALAQLGIGVPIVLIKYVKSLWSSRTDLEWLERLTPWGWKFDLFHPDFGKVGLAALVMFGFFAVFAFLGTRHFLRRDL